MAQSQPSSEPQAAGRRRRRRRRKAGTGATGTTGATNETRATPPVKATPANTPKPSTPAPEPALPNNIYAAVDLGTNNCRMLVAKPTPSGFRVIDSFSRIVRLGEGIHNSGRLSEEAIERTVEALKVCAQKMRDRGVTRFRNVATEACRRADNGEEFLARVAAETGIELEPITATEEARLALAGCAMLLRRRARRALVFDIGGGSTEVVWVEVPRHGPPRPLATRSLAHGVVTLSEMFPADPLPEADYQAILRLVDRELAKFDEENGISQYLQSRPVQMLGTSGTVTTLGAVHLGLSRYIRAQVDGLEISFAEMETARAGITALSPDQRAQHPCIGSERADLVVAGCAILDAIMQRWPVPRIRIADRGIREGLLYHLMSEDGHRPRWRPRHQGGSKGAPRPAPDKERQPNG